ncbi:hypothetical protein HK096_011486 [Nowakowskiella sp. JEL0078]|nr:hypothetical protein HK096_011486 [Nowakowskiella sp. JEL0078]
MAHLYLIQRVNQKGNHSGTASLFSLSQQLFVGIYISQFTLTGLFALLGANVLWSLMLFQIAITIAFHSYTQKYSSLILQVPISVILETQNQNDQPEEISNENSSIFTIGHLLHSIFTQLRTDAFQVLHDLRDLIRWKFLDIVTGVTVGLTDGIVVATGVDRIIKKSSNETSNRMRTPTNRPLNVDDIEIVASTSDRIHENILEKFPIQMDDRDPQSEMLVHPAGRRNAVVPVWIPSSDPLGVMEQEIMPEFVNGGIPVLVVDAKVDKKGKLTLGEKMIDLLI